MKKKIMALLLVCIFLLSLTACGKTEPPSDSEDTPVVSDPIGSAASDTEAPPDAGSGNVLIAYFTWADNTVVEDPNSVDVDASTSASLLAPGNTALMAQYIQSQVGGDLFSIRVTEPYSSDYDKCLDRAADEKAEAARPELVGTVENIADYDTVYLGFPNWWYTCPMAVFSFVESHDLSGKTIIPFCAHGTAGLSRTVQDLTAALPADVTVLEPIGIFRDEMDQAEELIDQWLETLA